MRALVLAAAAAALCGPAAADSLLNCESAGYKYTYCPADTRFGVEIQTQKSSTPCVLNNSWGYDGGGVWVDKGCRATFRILSGRGGKPPPPEPYDIEGEDLIASDILAELRDEDDADRREPGYGRADALIACALYADQEELGRGARAIFIDEVSDVVPRGRRAYDVSFTITVERRRGGDRDYAAECTVNRGSVTSYVRY